MCLRSPPNIRTYTCTKYLVASTLSFELYQYDLGSWVSLQCHRIRMPSRVAIYLFIFIISYLQPSMHVSLTSTD